MMEINGKPATPDDLASVALYNYGHFTSMRIEGGKVRGLSLHLDRLVDDCRILFGVALDREWVRRLVRRVVPVLPSPCVVRVTIFAPDLDLGHPATVVEPCVLVTARPAAPGRLPGLRLASVAYERDLPQAKHVGLFATVYHRRTAQLAGSDDVLFVDTAGHILEGATWNIGFFDGVRVVWPKSACLPGVTMRLLKQALLDADVGSVDVTMDAALLDRMEFAFVTNAAIGVRAVQAIDHKTFDQDSPVFDLLRDRYLAVPAEDV